MRWRSAALQFGIVVSMSLILCPAVCGLNTVQISRTVLGLTSGFAVCCAESLRLSGQIFHVPAGPTGSACEPSRDVGWAGGWLPEGHSPSAQQTAKPPAASKDLKANLDDPLCALNTRQKAASANERQFLYRKRYAMGTVYEIVAYSPSLQTASQATDAALNEVVELDHVMSNYDTESDLSRLDRSAHFRAVRVPPDLFRVIQDSFVYSRLSNGKYDVTVAPLVDAWKAAMVTGQAPSFAQITRLRKCVGYQKVQLIPPDSIEFHSTCTRIDLGSIGKGYAVDRAVEILRAYGIRNALIDAGGSTLYGMGAPPGQTGWSVRLRDPSARIAPEVILHNDSVSTSEQEKTSLIQPQTFGHIIDPITAMPLRSDFAVSAVAASATATDGLSTTLFLLGPIEGSRVVRKLTGTAAIWISPTGEERVASTGPRIFTNSSYSANN
jgi:FAD:protein FMN transferase